jgi:superoxide reductase
MATEVGQTYYCSICGNKVEVIESGDGELVCCGEPMELVEPEEEEEEEAEEEEEEEDDLGEF